jgi:hypothetical protein
MNAQAIIAALSKPNGLPRAALAAATENRAELAPVFIAEMERYLAGDAAAAATPELLFFMFHLLGEWGETAAYPVLARFLQSDPDKLNRILDDATTETAHRVMAGVFDGEPRPLYDIILDPQADEFVRARMIDVLAMLVAQGKMERDVVADFLRHCFTAIQPQGTCFVWDGWHSSIAMLGLTELTPLVEDAFRREFICPTICEFDWFEKELADSLASPPFALLDTRDYRPFGNCAEEFKSWHGFSEAYRQEMERPQELDYWALPAPAVNPYREVGRNDPCPCGSGKKFKKCCLEHGAADNDLAA